MFTDPIADMLTRIRNAQMSKKATAQIPFSKVKKAILDILQQEGYVDSVEIQDGAHKHLLVGLKYNEKKPAITSLKRESKPGHRMYKKAGDMPYVLNDFGIAIVSTSGGMMTNKQARKDGVGGEIICSVY